jgi:HEAT repeat protein
MAADRDATAAELIAAALTNPDDPALRALQDRPTRETFDAAIRLLASDATPERELGVKILGQLGGSGTDLDRPFREASVLALLELLPDEREPRVLVALGWAFAHLDEPRGVAPLSALAGHPSERVRSAVVHALIGHVDDLAVRTVLQLSADPDDAVRDWATFGLGTLLRLDTPAIRDALLARLDDPHHDTREEAMYGLAVRLDARAVPVLLDFLEEYEGPMLDSALLILADHLDDPRLAAAIAERWPAGVPADARDQADSDWYLASGQLASGSVAGRRRLETR